MVSCPTGGLSTSFQSLKANLVLSLGVALTGIVLPIGLSYTLQGLLNASPVQAFAAGAALCSTSLGTTFTVLGSSGLAATRLGVVLTSAAMMDDVVGLVMVQVISNRPVLVSIALAAVAPIACLLVAKPLTMRLNAVREAHAGAPWNALLQRRQTAFTMHTLILVGLVTGATYAGTSNLFAAYVAGASISWWDSDVPHPVRTSTLDGAAIYEHYYHVAVSKVLQPFFFASIGFSIPITRMFRGAIVWRGVVYAVLMSFAKLVCGLWLVRLPVSPGKTAGSSILSKVRLPWVPQWCGKSDRPAPLAQAGATSARSRPTDSSRSSEGEAPKPLSLHPPLILAFAMCARGEIGFLISGVAESQGVFGESGGEPTDMFLVVTWAIVLCTVAGPLAVGLSVRRVKELQAHKNRQQEGAGRDVLGVWGVE
jgi:hypothetical protein